MRNVHIVQTSVLILQPKEVVLKTQNGHTVGYKQTIEVCALTITPSIEIGWINQNVRVNFTVNWPSIH